MFPYTEEAKEEVKEFVEEVKKMFEVLENKSKKSNSQEKEDAARKMQEEVIRVIEGMREEKKEKSCLPQSILKFFRFK